jgi:hypothetical protein
VEARKMEDPKVVAGRKVAGRKVAQRRSKIVDVMRAGDFAFIVTSLSRKGECYLSPYI